MIVQREHHRDPFGQAPDEVAREGSVVVNVDEVHLPHGLVHALRETRARVISGAALPFKAWDAHSQEPINETRPRDPRGARLICRRDEPDAVSEPR